MVGWVFTRSLCFILLPTAAPSTTASPICDLHSPLLPRWILTRSSPPSGASENTRRSCTYGFVCRRSFSLSTWWWAFSPEPRRLTNAETAPAPALALALALARRRGTARPSPVAQSWTSLSRSRPASQPMRRCPATGLSASPVPRAGCTAGRPSRAPQSQRLVVWELLVVVVVVLVCLISTIAFACLMSPADLKDKFEYKNRMIYLQRPNFMHL